MQSERESRAHTVEKVDEQVQGLLLVSCICISATVQFLVDDLLVMDGRVVFLNRPGISCKRRAIRDGCDNTKGTST